MKCPKCGEECQRDEVDIGVGIQYGPFGCPSCAWSEWKQYDLSEGQSPVKESGAVIDQYGGLWPAGSPVAAAIRAAEKLDPRDPDPSRKDTFFQYHNCWMCEHGKLKCPWGGPNKCSYPHARDD